MITIDTVIVCDIPVAREALGFPKEGDRGNAVLLLAHEMRPQTRAAYQQAGCLIADCSKDVFAVLEQLQLRYCPWPDRGFTLAILDHKHMGGIADRIVVLRLSAEASADNHHSNETETEQ